MALEDLVGPDKFLDALVITNPEATDVVEEGDDHIRGEKNVLINSFGAMDEFMSFLADTPIILPDLITGIPDNATPANSILGLVSTGGKVGIGTLVPAEILTLAGDGSVLQIEDAGGTAKVLLGLLAGGESFLSMVDATTNLNTAMRSDAAVSFINAVNAQNFGVGLPAPLAPFHLKRLGVAELAIHEGDVATGNFTSYNDNIQNRGLFGYGSSLFVGFDNSAFGMRVGGGGTFAVSVGNATTRMTIDTSGNMALGPGAGTVSAKGRLDVFGGEVFLDLPTVGTGTSGSLWNNGGIVNVVP